MKSTIKKEIKIILIVVHL